MKVFVDGRTFIIKFDENGFIANIYERRLDAKREPFKSWYDAHFYNAKNYSKKGFKSTKPNSMLRRVMQAVKDKQKSDE